MVHYNFEILNCNSFEDFKSNLNKSKIIISDNNDEVTFLKIEQSAFKSFNNYIGDYRKYNILKENTILGILNTFYDNKNNYLTRWVKLN
jgi:hypothetical protein